MRYFKSEANLNTHESDRFVLFKRFVSTNWGTGPVNKFSKSAFVNHTKENVCMIIHLICKDRFFSSSPSAILPFMSIIPTWKDHPLTKQGVVELVPTAWLYTYRGPDVTPLADTIDGTIVTVDELWENIQAEGLHDPVIIRVGTNNQKFRLEAGNHRIQVLYAHGVPFTPATVQIQSICGPHAPNVMTDASHNFTFPSPSKLIHLRDGYAKPSDVFKELTGKTEPV
jgi:hypothetical protein